MYLTVTQAVVDRGQRQITVKGGPIAKLHKGQRFQITGKTKSGKELSFIQGDTHAIWEKHQADKTLWNEIYTKLAENVGAVVTIDLLECKEVVGGGVKEIEI